jgi:hypothetical protein
MTKRIDNFGPVGRPAGPITKRTSPPIYLSLYLSAIVSLFFVFFLPLSVNGYVLPGQHLLLMMTESLGSATSLTVHQRTFLYDDSAQGPQAELSETLTYRFSNAFLSESVSPHLTRIHLDVLDDAVTIVDNRLALQDESRFDRYKDLLLFHSRILLTDRLSRRGIDTMISSLGRFEGEPVYVLGAQYPDKTMAQIWIEKETFRPLRLLIPMTGTEGSVEMLEFRYLLWQENGKVWYPLRIECYENERLIRMMVVSDMEVDPLIDDEDFDIGFLRAQYGEEAYIEEDLLAPEEEDDIQKALDDFKKRYE